MEGHFDSWRKLPKDKSLYHTEYTDKRGCTIIPGDIAAFVGNRGILVFEVLCVTLEGRVHFVVGSAYINLITSSRTPDGDIRFTPIGPFEYALINGKMKPEEIFILQHGKCRVCADSEKELLEAYNKLALV